MAEVMQPSQVFLAVEPVDMRWGIDRLSVVIKPMNSRNKATNPIDLSAPAGEALSPQIPLRDAEIIRLTEIINSQTSTIRSQDIKIQALVQEVAYLRRIRYGVKSEAMSPEQRQLFVVSFVCLSVA